MAMTTISSRELNQDTARAKRAARMGPVFITDRGRPAHVLLSIKQYEKLTGKQKSIVEMLAMPEAAEIDFEPPRLGDEYPLPVDLS
jgi:prevent-host-death family protein